MSPRRLLPTLLALPLILGAWTTLHLDLVASLPWEDQVLEEAPEVVWLEFSAAPELARSSFSIRGPDGSVTLGKIERGESERVLRATVVGDMPAGTYMLSWVGAAADDHSARGRFEFTLGEAQ